jgi:hypothetical protein
MVGSEGTAGSGAEEYRKEGEGDQHGDRHEQEQVLKRGRLRRGLGPVDGIDEPAESDEIEGRRGKRPVEPGGQRTERRKEGRHSGAASDSLPNSPHAVNPL